MAYPSTLNPAASYAPTSVRATLAGSIPPGKSLQFSTRVSALYGGRVLVGEEAIARFVPVLIGPHRRVLDLFADGRWKTPSGRLIPPPIP